MGLRKQLIMKVTEGCYENELLAWYNSPSGFYVHYVYLSFSKEIMCEECLILKSRANYPKKKEF